jgi:hypothetical protein
MDEAISITFPVFIVWCVVKEVKKEYIVVDLHPFNKVAILDNYSLPLQQEIIDSIRGKKYITVIDISNFFFQLFVHPDYRDCFTFIS